MHHDGSPLIPTALQAVVSSRRGEPRIAIERSSATTGRALASLLHNTDHPPIQGVPKKVYTDDAVELPDEMIGRWKSSLDFAQWLLFM